MRNRVLALATLFVVAAGGVIFSLHVPYQGFQDAVFLQVGRGTPTLDIGRALAQSGVIRYPWQFWAERILHRAGKIQAGEYQFHEAASVDTVFDRMVHGDVYYFEFTVKEGSNMFDIGQSLASAGVMAATDFLQAAADPSPIHDIDSSAPSLEGYLFPSTYRLSHSTTAAELCREMTGQFRKQWRRLVERAGESASVRADVHRIVTIASMVEKETGIATERAVVAGVFVNRLDRGMKLDCDPTTVYAALLENRFHSVIHKSDLASQNPYNTYQHAGLPPGPIANPGIDTIQAALQPASTDYLYFVAKPGGGGHQFSSTLAGHERATREYRKAHKAE